MEQVKVQQSFDKSWQNSKYAKTLGLIVKGFPVVAARDQDADSSKRNTDTVTAQEWLEMSKSWDFLKTPEFRNYVRCPGCGGHLYVVSKRKNAAPYWVHNPRQKNTKTCTYSWKVPDKELTPKDWWMGMRRAAELNGYSNSIVSKHGIRTKSKVGRPDLSLNFAQDPRNPNITRPPISAPMLINGEPAFNQDGHTKVNSGVYKDLFSEDFNKMDLPKAAYIHLRGRIWTRHTDKKDGLWKQVLGIKGISELEQPFYEWCTKKGYMYFTKLSAKGKDHWKKTRERSGEAVADPVNEEAVKPYTPDLPVIPEAVEKPVAAKPTPTAPPIIEPEPDRVAVLCANTLYVGLDVTQFRGHYAVKLFNGDLAIISKGDTPTAHRVYCNENTSKIYERKYRGKMIIK